MVGPRCRSPGTILHEFGHVLGLIHEWQNPNAEIAWNKSATIDYFVRISGWTAEMVERQVFEKVPATVPPYRPFDPKSVMCYPIPPGLTTDGLVVGFNNDLSQSDKSFIAGLYPAPPRRRQCASVKSSRG